MKLSRLAHCGHTWELSVAARKKKNEFNIIIKYFGPALYNIDARRIACRMGDGRICRISCTSMPHARMRARCTRSRMYAT